MNRTTILIATSLALGPLSFALRAVNPVPAPPAAETPAIASPTYVPGSFDAFDEKALDGLNNLEDPRQKRSVQNLYNRIKTEDERTLLRDALHGVSDSEEETVGLRSPLTTGIISALVAGGGTAGFLAWKGAGMMGLRVGGLVGLAGLAAGVGIHALIRQHQIQTLQKKAHGGFQEVYEPLAQQYIDSDSIRTEHIDSNPSTTGPSTSGPTEDLMGDDLIQTMDTTESPESGAASAESVPTE